MFIKAIAGAAIAAATLGVAPASADKPPNFIVGTPLNDWLIGTKHPDVILGRAGNDLLGGRRGDDRLRGGSGNDHLVAWGPVGHSGVDILNGGTGRDRCVGDANDTFRGCEVVVVRG